MNYSHTLLILEITQVQKVKWCMKQSLFNIFHSTHVFFCLADLLSAFLSDILIVKNPIKSHLGQVLLFKLCIYLPIRDTFQPDGITGCDLNKINALGQSFMVIKDSASLVLYLPIKDWCLTFIYTLIPGFVSHNCFLKSLNIWTNFVWSDWQEIFWL